MHESQVAARRIRDAVHEQVSQALVLANPNLVDLLLVSLICRGHVLLNDVPGIGKTMLARSLAATLGVSFGRIQFTPDLLPADITGANYYDQRENEFRFRPGPVFTHFLLADEINRATPRTQAALLECMQESTVTIDGLTRRLEQPFMVIATQNPVEMEGTFPLPEAQLDRFLMCLELGYPDPEGEAEIITRFLNREPINGVRAVVDRKQLPVLWDAVSAVALSEPVKAYVVSLARATRDLDGVRVGVSPRGTLSLARSAQALAALRGRSFVSPEDVQYVAGPVLSHRLVLEHEASLTGQTTRRIIKTVIDEVPVPDVDEGDDGER